MFKILVNGEKVSVCSSEELMDILADLCEAGLTGVTFTRIP